MTKKEQIINVLERMGYKPKIDKEGDIMLRYQLKTLFFLVNDDDEENFVNVILPQFAEIDDGEETLYLAACNKVTRGTRMVKVYVDQTFKNITASCEFYYANDESLEFNLQKSLSILSIIRTLYRNCIKEVSED